MINWILRRLFFKELVRCDHIEDIRDVFEACEESLYWLQERPGSLIIPIPPETIAAKREESMRHLKVLLNKMGHYPSLPEHRLGYTDCTTWRRAQRDKKRKEF